MAMWLLLFAAPAFALYDEKFKLSYESILEKKCEALKMHYPAAFIGDRCFAATRNTYTVRLEDWHTLHKKCNHLYGYHGQMGNIFNEQQLQVLMDNDVLEMSQKYFVGARQSPTDVEMKIPLDNLNTPEHKKRWKYFNSEGQEMGELNAKLWLKDQPDNSGKNPPEFVVAIERLNVSMTLGFNDINPSADSYSVLCEYVDYLSCPADWTLIGSECYLIGTTPLTLEDARDKCSKGGGKLATIHNDKVNQFIAQIANEAFKKKRIDEDDEELSHNPVLFGLVYENDGYKYDNGDPVDFFRWHDKAGMGIPKRNSGVLLNTYVTGAKGEPRFTYWTQASPNKKYPYVCQSEAAIDALQ